jgi:flagellar basal body P-ring formation protein FlgA
MLHRAACLALAVLLAPAAAAQIAVDDEWVRLGDVAPVAGEAAAVLLAPTPPAGETLALDPAFIIAVAKRSGVVVALPLGEPVWVTRPGAAAPVAPVARSAPQAPVAPVAHGGPASSGPPGHVLVLVTDKARGEVLSAADLDWAPARPGARNALTHAEAAVGRALRRPLKAGAPLLASDIEAPAVVRKGDPLKLVYASPGLKLTVDGVAQSNAAEGEKLRVLNTHTRRSVDAIAVAPGEARIAR